MRKSGAQKNDRHASNKVHLWLECTGGHGGYQCRKDINEQAQTQGNG